MGTHSEHSSGSRFSVFVSVRPAGRDQRYRCARQSPNSGRYHQGANLHSPGRYLRSGGNRARLQLPVEHRVLRLEQRHHSRPLPRVRPRGLCRPGTHYGGHGYARRGTRDGGTVRRHSQDERRLRRLERGLGAGRYVRLRVLHPPQELDGTALDFDPTKIRAWYEAGLRTARDA